MMKSEIEEYNQLCNSMEVEVEGLLKASVLSPTLEGRCGQCPYLSCFRHLNRHGLCDRFSGSLSQAGSPRLNIEDMYTKLMLSMEDEDSSTSKSENKTNQSREAFWREINQSEERFETIARFFAKGIIQ
jgi:hypothetical protein